MQCWQTGSWKTMDGLHPDVILAIGAPGFGQTAMRALFDLLKARHLAVYSRRPDSTLRLWLSTTVHAAPVTQLCWSAYRRAFGCSDPTWSMIHERLPASGAMVGLQHVEDIQIADYRDAIYTRYGLTSRLSAYTTRCAGEILAINAYRTREDVPFSPDDVEVWGKVAPGLLAATVRHLELVRHVTPGASEPGGADPVASLASKLAAPSYGLSSREVEVCARILVGQSYKDVARDLRISLSSVKTYRERGFRHLRMTSKKQLIASIVSDTPMSLVGAAGV